MNEHTHPGRRVDHCTCGTWDHVHELHCGHDIDDREPALLPLGPLVSRPYASVPTAPSKPERQDITRAFAEPVLRESSLTSATEAQIAWATGIFEGEGHVAISERRPGQWHCHLAMTMTDEDVVRRVASILGGSVSGPHRRPEFEPHHKSFWRWHISRHDDVGAAVGRMWPWLGERRRKKLCEARDKTHLRFSSMGPRKAPWRVAGMPISAVQHNVLIVLTQWAAHVADFGADDLVDMVKKPWKYEAEFAEALDWHDEQLAATGRTES